MTQWEHHTQPVPLNDLQAMLVAAGQQGWECCGIVPGVGIQGTIMTGPPVPGVLVILKRPLSSVNGQVPSAILTSGG